MKYLSFLLKTITSVSLLVLISFRCASVGTNFCNDLAARYSGTGSYPLTETLLYDGLTSQFLAFRDSLQRDTIAYLWNNHRKLISESLPEKKEPTIHNLSAMASIIKYRGYTCATLHPDTYESIYALSKLPLLIWIGIIHHKDKKNTIITDKNLTLYESVLLSPYTNDMRMHLIRNITKSGDTYSVTTYDNVSFTGLANDNCNGQVVASDQKTSGHYIQLVDCFIVSSLPLMEIEEHISEWYTQTPYKYVKPNIQEF